MVYRKWALVAGVVREGGPILKRTLLATVLALLVVLSFGSGLALGSHWDAEIAWLEDTGRALRRVSRDMDDWASYYDELGAREYTYWSVASDLRDAASQLRRAGRSMESAASNLGFVNFR